MGPWRSLGPCTRYNQCMNGVRSICAKCRLFEDTVKSFLSAPPQSSGPCTPRVRPHGVSPFLLKESGCVIYSFGLANDPSFDIEFAKTTNCSVYAFDKAFPIESKDFIFILRAEVPTSGLKFGVLLTSPYYS